VPRAGDGDLACAVLASVMAALHPRLDRRLRVPIARVAGPAVLQTAVHWRLAVTNLVIALVLGRLILGQGAPAVLFATGGTAARFPSRSSAPYRRSVRNYQLSNCYVDGERARPNGDPSIFAFPAVSLPRARAILLLP
jgi:hypothetical protein